MDLTNNNPEIVIARYNYRVQECGIKCSADGLSAQRYRTDLDFKCDDLLESRAAAEYWYMKKLREIHTFDSLTLNLVEHYGDTHQYEEYCLLGEDEETNAEGREIESQVLECRGLKLEAKY